MEKLILPAAACSSVGIQEGPRTKLRLITAGHWDARQTEDKRPLAAVSGRQSLMSQLTRFCLYLIASLSLLRCIRSPC